MYEKTICIVYLPLPFIFRFLDCLAMHRQNPLDTGKIVHEQKSQKFRGVFVNNEYSYSIIPKGC